MKIKYISHACLYIESGADRILVDPWFGSPAYLNNWHICPQPADVSVLSRSNVILVSHGHEDHLHPETLARCNKEARVFCPLQPESGNAKFFREALGFRDFVEARGNRNYRLPGGTKLTLHPVGRDCIFVLEDEHHVLVNVNDALHSCPVELIEDVCTSLRKRYPKIDYVFCGYGGASYFPNCFHHASKPDFDVAVVREALFARNFCLIVDRLEARIGVPFAADFRLRHRSIAWINDTRFERERMPDLYAALFPKSTARTTIIPLLPGQGFSDTGEIFGNAEAAPYPDFTEILPIDRALDSVAGDYAALITGNLARYPFPHELLPFSIEVKATDASAWIVIAGDRGGMTASVAKFAPPECAVTATIGADCAEYLLKLDWHSDVIVIGYAMEFYISDTIPMTDRAVHALGDIVTHYPNAKKAALRKPLRFSRWAIDNLQVRHLVRRRLRRGTPAFGFADVSLADWLSNTPETLARRLGIPEGFARSMHVPPIPP